MWQCGHVRWCWCEHPYTTVCAVADSRWCRRSLRRHCHLSPAKMVRAVHALCCRITVYLAVKPSSFIGSRRRKMFAGQPAIYQNMFAFFPYAVLSSCEVLRVLGRMDNCWFLSASLYVSKRGAYWNRLCRDVVGRWLVGRWLSRACTVTKRCILGL